MNTRYSLGFDLSLSSVEDLVLAQEDLDGPLRDLGGEPRWYDAPAIRVPLRTFEPVEPDFVHHLSDTIAAVAEALVPFKVGVIGLQALPSPAVPRFVCGRIVLGKDLVDGLHKVLQVRLARLGLADDDRPFEALVPIGRVRTPGDAIDVAEILEPFRQADFGETFVRSLVLLAQNWRDDELPPPRVHRRFRLGT